MYRNSRNELELDFNDVYNPPTGDTEYVPYEKIVTITEKKAPTDESLRLLLEMQEKVRKSIINTERINNNVIDGILFTFAPQMGSLDQTLFFRFKINGIEHVIEDTYTGQDMSKHQCREDMVKRIISKLSTSIAVHLFRDANDFWYNALFKY